MLFIDHNILLSRIMNDENILLWPTFSFTEYRSRPHKLPLEGYTKYNGSFVGKYTRDTRTCRLTLNDIIARRERETEKYLALIFINAIWRFVEYYLLLNLVGKILSYTTDNAENYCESILFCKRYLNLMYIERNKYFVAVAFYVSIRHAEIFFVEIFKMRHFILKELCLRIIFDTYEARNEKDCYIYEYNIKMESYILLHIGLIMIIYFVILYGYSLNIIYYVMR